MTAQELKLVAALIRKEVSEQMRSMRKEIVEAVRQEMRGGLVQLTEARPPANEVLERMNSLPQFRERPVETRRPQRQYSSNPILNDLLASTEPIPADGPPAHFTAEDFGYTGPLTADPVDLPVNTRLPHMEHPPAPPSRRPVNVVTTDPEGKPVNLATPEAKKVLDIMNMNFGDKLKRMEESAKQHRQAITGM
jgi:hypothetical protein